MGVGGDHVAGRERMPPVVQAGTSLPWSSQLKRVDKHTEVLLDRLDDEGASAIVHEDRPDG